MDRREFVLLAAASAVGTSQARAASIQAASSATNFSRSTEVRAQRLFAESTHPRGCEAAANPDWRDRWNRLEASADVLSDGAYFIRSRRALGWFGDGHTTMLPFEFTGGVPAPLKSGPFGLTLPVRIRLFHDGAYITATDEEHSHLLGARVNRVGSRSVEEVVRALAEDWPGNWAWAHRWAGLSLSSPAHLQGLGALDDPRRAVLFTTFISKSQTIDLSPIAEGSALNELTRPTTSVERWAGEAGRGNYVRPLRDRNAVYISIDDMADGEGKTFEQLTRDAFAALALDWPERVVIDLRRNGGGNNFLGEPLRKRIAASRFNRPGGLYVLIGPPTFSAGQNLANRLERETFALFVGEPTGGSPNHYGDAKIFQGKATGLTTIVSSLPWFDSYPQDQRKWIMPDLPMPASFANWRAGRDAALELALTHVPQRQTDELDRERIFFFERASQSQDWRPFWVS